MEQSTQTQFVWHQDGLVLNGPLATLATSIEWELLGWSEAPHHVITYTEDTESWQTVGIDTNTLSVDSDVIAYEFTCSWWTRDTNKQTRTEGRVQRRP